jgi:hypothetical protein
MPLRHEAHVFVVKKIHCLWQFFAKCFCALWQHSAWKQTVHRHATANLLACYHEQHTACIWNLQQHNVVLPYKKSTVWDRNLRMPSSILKIIRLKENSVVHYLVAPQQWGTQCLYLKVTAIECAVVAEKNNIVCGRSSRLPLCTLESLHLQQNVSSAFVWARCIAQHNASWYLKFTSS